jgi:hypothetical protein
MHRLAWSIDVKNSCQASTSTSYSSSMFIPHFSAASIMYEIMSDYTNLFRLEPSNQGEII